VSNVECLDSILVAVEPITLMSALKGRVGDEVSRVEFEETLPTQSKLVRRSHARQPYVTDLGVVY
jgi:hypothetical protein